ncbi:uncharacterized protein K489DRAFT_404286 [Dissoconium aciculare CBS 342.82]|uniref:Steroid 5-alpha reductase C-terminal domain-containing protein n=1 Tax=Dissoconium aciculare CBS 342.82 TaxID=1314786 RepID=A0A6J3LV76_9PEZI|nr:uncharacterized protein K489DRAFT_404286 [Dissoconium aciculare CBS 342.82]KAF1819670.1 hypothetical protein K489DRAFT_404286 [Dissoconium aciculare CBS 342.82]
MADKTTPTKHEPSQAFWENRKKGRSLAGILAFSGASALDIPFQHWLLQSGAAATLLHRLGARTVSQTILPAAQQTAVGLSPYHTLIWGLAIGGSVKRIYWNIFVGDTLLQPGLALGVGLFSTALNALNTLLALWLATSQQPSDQSSLQAFLATAPPSLYIGVGLFSLGLFTEWYSEVQRKAFKQDPANRGRPYSGGLFGLARNINYGGFTLWRTGASLASGGWAWAGATALWIGGDFCSRSIPDMDAYCEKRYGEQWDVVRRKVPYKLLPWIY